MSWSFIATCRRPMISSPAVMSRESLPVATALQVLGCLGARQFVDRKPMAARRLDLAYRAMRDSELRADRRAGCLKLRRGFVQRLHAEDQDRALAVQMPREQDRRTRRRLQHRHARTEALDGEDHLGAERLLEPVELGRRVRARHVDEVEALEPHDAAAFTAASSRSMSAGSL